MAIILWVATVIITLQACNSYILLTANVEDVHAIVKQLADSPVADQVKKIWRRASSQFNQYIVKNKPQMRADDADSINRDEQLPRDDAASNRYYSDENKIGRRTEHQDGAMRNVSYYLSSIKKIMDTI